MSIAEPTRRWLLASAREALAQAIDRSDVVAPLATRPEDPVLDMPARVFVSWHDGPRLLGCIGTVQAAESLAAAVRHYAVQAGLHDPRMGPMTVDELGRAHAEIAVLGPERELDARGLEAIADALVPGRDGVILRLGHRRALFLPVVWEKLPGAAEFLDALCRKAGILEPGDRARVQAHVFEVESWSD
jgi:uncharacterized protein